MINSKFSHAGCFIDWQTDEPYLAPLHKKGSRYECPCNETGKENLAIKLLGLDERGRQRWWPHCHAAKCCPPAGDAFFGPDGFLCWVLASSHVVNRAQYSGVTLILSCHDCSQIKDKPMTLSGLSQTGVPAKRKRPSLQKAYYAVAKYYRYASSLIWCLLELHPEVVIELGHTLPVGELPFLAVEFLSWLGRRLIYHTKRRHKQKAEERDCLSDDKAQIMDRLSNIGVDAMGCERFWRKVRLPLSWCRRRRPEKLA